MKYDFCIKTFRIEKNPTDVICYTEGTLDVYINKEKKFSEEGILLVEFAIVLSKWLDKNKLEGYPIDLFYASMDFEEEPILALSYDVSKKHYIFDSVWRVTKAEVTVDSDEAVEAAKSYIDELSKTLYYKYNVNLRQVIQAAKDWEG